MMTMSAAVEAIKSHVIQAVLGERVVPHHSVEPQIERRGVKSARDVPHAIDSQLADVSLGTGREGQVPVRPVDGCPLETLLTFASPDALGLGPGRPRQAAHLLLRRPASCLLRTESPKAIRLDRPAAKGAGGCLGNGDA